MNSLGKGNCRIGRGEGDSLKTARLLTLACFTAILTVHIGVLSRFDGFTRKEKPLTEAWELSLTLDAADPITEDGDAGEEVVTEAVPELPFPPVSLPQEALILPEPVSEAIPLLPEASPLDSLSEPEMPFPAAASLSEPERVLPEAGSFSAGALSSAGATSSAGAEAASVQTGHVTSSDLPGSPLAGPVSVPKHTMTDAEYLALIMGRLEKNKIYPLSVRKRGIEGDIRVHFTIRQDGTVSEIGLADPSGHRFLVQAAFETIRSASPFPIMEGREGDYTAQVNIRYRLEDQATHKK
jgi:TonB family protein